MEFSPISEDEAREASKPGYLLKPGPCSFEVRQAGDETSKKGNPMMHLTLDVWDADGKQGIVHDYLLDAIPHKLRHAAYAVGLGRDYESGKLEAAQFLGKGGNLILRTELGKGEYGAKNAVADYLLPDRVKTTPGYQAAKSKDAGGDPKKTPRGEARLRFLAHVTQLDPAARESAWRQALDQFFGHSDQAKVTDADWQRFAAALPQWKAGVGFPHTMRVKVETAAPIGEGKEFSEDDIPFD